MRRGSGPDAVAGTNKIQVRIMAFTRVNLYNLPMTARSPVTITAVTFDLGDVLVKVDKLRFCRGLAALLNRRPQAVHAEVIDSRLEQDFDTGRISSRDFYRRVMDHFRLDLPYARFCDLWNEMFDPMAGMEEVVTRLAPRSPLYLLSNTNTLHFDYLKDRFSFILRHFQAFILSYQVGSRKPEPGIYQALIHRVGRPPEQILYFDDKPAFVEAARRHGLTARQFTSPQDAQRALEEHGLC